MADAKARLIEILRERSIRRERFVLASGKESDFYIDVRQTTLHPEGAFLVASLLLERLRPEVRAVGGPVTGADPIAGAVAAISFTKGRPVQGFMVRKALKDHGTGQWIEGRGGLANGAAVCVVEDTVTSGGSVLEAIRTIEREGLRVVQCLCVVDRAEGAKERFAAVGHTLESLVTRAELE
jgi:orotate phosphoribosyltransferase